MDSETTSEAVTGLVEPVASAHGLELVDVEFGAAGRRTVVRLILDRQGGITVDDLAQLSREVSDLLDAHETLPQGYTLECSSPGVNRPLKTPEDFARFCGKSVALQTVEPVHGVRSLSGVLLTADEAGVELEDGAVGRVSVPYGVIEKANYQHDFARDFRGERD